MKLERKVRLCSAAAAVLIAAIALTGCGGSKTTASSAAASSVAASTAAATNNSCGEGVTWALADVIRNAFRRICDIHIHPFFADRQRNSFLDLDLLFIAAVDIESKISTDV